MNTERIDKRVAIWTITKSGYKHGVNLARNIDDSILFISKNLSGKLNGLEKLHSSFSKNPLVFSKLSNHVKSVFNDFDGHIFVFSTGIAVRTIAPLIKSKIEDPAVVVLDDKAIHAISLLSGHIGGANELTKKVCSITQANPVITTATDIHNKPAIDILAIENNMYIANPGMIKKINMAILENKNIKIHDPNNILAPKLPNSISTRENPDIICTDKTVDVPRGTLLLNPPSLIVGMGCNRGTSLEEIEKFLISTLDKNNLTIKSIWAFASIDAKADEAGFLKLSKKLGIRFLFIDKQRLASTNNIKNPSKIVEKYMGVKSVCEAAALTAGNQAKLIVQKQISGNVTIAIARQNLSSM